MQQIHTTKELASSNSEHFKLCSIIRDCREETLDELKEMPAKDRDIYTDIDDFNQVIRMNETYALAYNNRGLCYDKLNEYDLAIIDYEKSIELNPLDYRPYFNMGLTYMSQGEVKAAKICFDYSIELNPLQADGYKNRGLILELLGLDPCEDFKSACLFGENECCEWGKTRCD